MIYHYEGAFLRWVHDCIPEIRQATYASDEDLLNGLDSVREFPSFYYSRDTMSVEWDKTITIPPQWLGKDNVVPEFNFYPYEQHYTGTIFVENQAAAFHTIKTLKYHWRETPYMDVLIPGLCDYLPEEEKTTRVELRLLDIGVDDVRLPNDKNGACRAVRFKWYSNLLLSDIPQPYSSGLVEKVNLRYQDSTSGEGETIVIEK